MSFALASCNLHYLFHVVIIAIFAVCADFINSAHSQRYATSGSSVPYYAFANESSSLLSRPPTIVLLSAYERCLLALRDMSEAPFDSQSACLQYSKSVVNGSNIVTIPRVCMVGYRLVRSFVQ